MLRHFLSLADAGGDALAAILADARMAKGARAGQPKGMADCVAGGGGPPLAGHTLAMIFEKSSTRTRVSFDMAMRQLGGSALVMDAGTMQLGRGETVADTARVLSRMVDGIMLRTDDHAKLDELAHFATVPVINGLTDRSHPCQIMADLLTLLERGHSLPGLQIAWLGDGNNVLHSLLEAAGVFKFAVRIGGLADYAPDPSIVAAARQAGADITVTADPASAVRGVDAVFTDCWVSMGQADSATKAAAMRPFQVNAALMALAKPAAPFLHCLPAHRGEEVTDQVIDGPQSAAWDAAENRVHAQKAILRWVFGQL